MMYRLLPLFACFILTGCEFLSGINTTQFPEQERGVADGIPFGQRRLSDLQEYGVILADSTDGTHIILPADKLFYSVTKQVTISPDFYPALNALIHVLEGYPKVNIQIVGHTDGVMSPDLQVTQSSKFAYAVSNYLTSGGLSPLRITVVKGVSDTQPINRGNTGAARALNRRVEIITSAPIR